MLNRVIAVGGPFEFPRYVNDDPFLAQQQPDGPVPHVDADLLQLFGHPGPPVVDEQHATYGNDPELSLDASCSYPMTVSV